MIDLEELLCRGEQIKQEEHNKKEEKAFGTFRGGNSGCLTDKGEIIGHCHRITLARYLGYNMPNREESKFFFAGGEANENIYADTLRRSWIKEQGGRLFREEQVPVQWTLKIDHDGETYEIPVTGRPDMELHDHEGGKIELGIEQKGVQSAYKAGLVFKDVIPGSDALCQAGHYSWQKRFAPWVISYAGYTSWFALRPGRRHFYLSWQGKGLDSILFFEHPDTHKKIETVITPAGIKRFYTLVWTMNQIGDLGPMFCDVDPKPKYKDKPYLPPSAAFAGGKEWAACNTCAFRDACERFGGEGEFDSWKDAVQVISEGGSL